MSTTNTTELKLETSGKVVVMREYLTTGQSRELQRLLMSRGTFNAAASTFDNVPAEVYLDMQDKALEFLVVEIKSSDGTSVPFSKEAIDDLPIADGNRLYEEVNKLIEASNLSEDQRKKS